MHEVIFVMYLVVLSMAVLSAFSFGEHLIGCGVITATISIGFAIWAIVVAIKNSV